MVPALRPTTAILHQTARLTPRNWPQAAPHALSDAARERINGDYQTMTGPQNA